MTCIQVHRTSTRWPAFALLNKNSMARRDARVILLSSSFEITGNIKTMDRPQTTNSWKLVARLQQHFAGREFNTVFVGSFESVINWVSNTQETGRYNTNVNLFTQGSVAELYVGI